MSDEMRENSQQKEHPAAKVFGWLVTAVCFGLIGWFANLWMPKGEGGRGPQDRLTSPAVTTVRVKLGSFNPPESFVAHVEAVKDVDILPQIDGYITEVKFQEGRPVKEGDLLFQIDTERYAATLALRESELAKNEAAVLRSEAELDRAQRYYSRLKKADARGITQSDLDTAETDLMAAKAGVAAAKADVKQAQANIALAKFDMKHTKVYAPISGQIGKALVHVGDYVSPAKGAMANIVQTDPIRVAFPMTDRAYITWREKVAEQGRKPLEDLRLRLKLPNGDFYEKTGSWDFDNNEMSLDTATMMVRLVFSNAKRILVPNTFVSLTTEKITPPKYLQLPDTALVDFPEGQGVWVMKEDGTAEQRLVKVFSTYKGIAAISKGVKEGEVVVDEGCHKVFPGLKLNVVNASPARGGQTPADGKTAASK